MALRAGVLTVSDAGAREEREDTAGPAVAAALVGAGFEVAERALLPDEPEQIAALLRRWSDEETLALVVTAGGTGLAARDRTPQATAAVLDYEVPGLAEAMRDADWEFIGHGMTQRLLHNEADEPGLITAVLDKIEAFTGTRPRGWMGPGFAQTFDTPDHLKAAGIEFNLDWVLDDLPCWMTTKHGPLLSMPYGFELNDSLMYTVERQASPALLQRLKDTLETFEPELAAQPRVLTLAVHPHQVAVPHRLPYLAQVLDLLLARDDTIFLTGSPIADWYMSVDPA